MRIENTQQMYDCYNIIYYMQHKADIREGFQ